jgi:hypothetical protein
LFLSGFEGAVGVVAVNECGVDVFVEVATAVSGEGAFGDLSRHLGEA